MNWGSVPDWLSVFIAILALLGFVIVERDRLILGKQRSGFRNKKNGLANDIENEQTKLTESKVDIRAELYSRILIGIIFGVALSPIYSWTSASLFSIDQYQGIFSSTTGVILTVLFSLIMSVILSFVYFRAYRRWASVFVHWVERLAFAYLGFWVILWYAGWSQNPTTHIYSLEPYPFINVIVSILMFLLLGFPSTPIDWIIHLVSKARERNN